MGMTIDDHIEVLKSYNNGFTGYAGNLQNSINVAIDTMRKYQKIREIATAVEWEKEVSYQSVIAMLNIRKVLEDGNDNNKV